MATRDAMEFINEQGDATLQRFIERFEFRGKDPTFVAYREAYLDQLGLSPSAAVLELGCGTGVVARALAGRAGFSGPITGVEGSASGSSFASVMPTRWSWRTPAST